MTQYVRVVFSTWEINRPLGTILKIRTINKYNGDVIVIENNKRYTDFYTKDEVEVIPEEISNSSLFKIILDEQNLEWYNELKKGGKMKLTKKDKLASLNDMPIPLHFRQLPCSPFSLPCSI